MKYVARIAFALALACPGVSIPAIARSVDRPPQRIVTYVRLQDWARLNQFQIRWLDRDKTLQLSNRLARIKLTINSVVAEINGVETRLCFPVAAQNGSITIAQTDAQRTFGPVIYPPANKSGFKIKTICLDPGHGGNDMGEKKYTLLLARELQDQLTRAGFKVVMTRTTDTRVELPDRAAFARRRKADLFLSLHFNSLPAGPDRSEVKGIETYCLTPAGAFSSNAQGEGDTRWLAANSNDEKNMLLAYQVQKSLIRGLNAEDRAVKRARFDHAGGLGRRRIPLAPDGTKKDS
jgi:N-acetylmuramoyl-L-alanine amidase